MGVGGSCTIVLLADGAARVARPGAGGMGPGRSGIGFGSVFGEPKLEKLLIFYLTKVVFVSNFNFFQKFGY